MKHFNLRNSTAIFVLLISLFSFKAQAQVPTLSSFSPTSGSTGTSVTIMGSNFTTATSVSFGNTNASNYSIVNDSTITATVGTGSTGNVTVGNAKGASSLVGFTYIGAAPVITYFSPTSTGSGSAVYIYGTGFTGATSVSFGGVPAASFIVISDTYIFARVGSGASGSVSVTTGGVASLAGFTYLTSPIVKSFSPTTAATGATVTIKGSNFTNATRVYFGSVAASGYIVVNDSTITATVSTGSSGSVVVYNATGSGTLGGFTYLSPVPVITSFSPTSTGSGSYVYIYGTGLTGATNVSFGGVPATSFNVYSDTYIYAYVGSGASGSISITTPGGTATLAGFTYLTTPIVKSFSPTSATKGSTVTIKGSNFTNATRVYFGNNGASGYIVVNDSTITATVGAGLSGSVTVSSSAGYGSLAGFTYLAPVPVITSFSPISAGTGGYVTIYGSGFVGATSVTFGGVPAANFYAFSDTYISAYVGGGASGSVSVTTSGGTASLVGFTYLLAPIVKSFSPAAATKGSIVTIKGSNFTNATNVSFGGTYATSYSVLNDSTITATVAAGLSGNVSVTSAGGTGYQAGFTYIAPVPVITSFSPTSAGQGRTVYIYGTGLAGATSVSFGGVPASSFYAYNDTYIYAYVGSGASGNVSITTSGGTATLAGFTYLASPVVKSFSPASATRGVSVTITGSGFLLASNVSFGGTSAAGFSILNDSTITATVATGSSGSVSVTSAGGTGYQGGFTYIAPVPVITSFSPTSAGLGGFVYLYGTGFTRATSVSFGGVAASSFYVNSDTYMYAYVGSGASGSVSITTPGGTATLAGFTYLAPAVIKSFSPTSATKGSTVTIKGSGFLSATSVSFGGTNAASFSIINDSTITATLAAGSSGNVSVTNSGGSGLLAGFTYIAPVPIITSFSPTTGGNGTYVYIYGSGFTGTTSVTFGGVPASSFYTSGDNYLYAYVGNGATGSVSVTTPGGTATLAGFTYLQPPVVKSFSPTSATKGATVTISGSNFSNATSISFGGTNAGGFSIVNDSTITATVAAGSSGNVTVANAVGSSLLPGFTYLAPVPTISSFSPTSAGKGVTVYIYGTGLSGTTSVSFGGVPATSFYAYSDTYMYAYVGNGASGNISVTTSGGTATLGGFTFIAPATVKSFSPTSASKGTTVNILGSGFLYANSVSFGGTSAGFTIIDDSTITAVVGTGTSGSVIVTTSGGSGSLAGFTYIAPVPVITSFSPVAAGKGSYVYIYGTGFTGATSVSFGGVPASSFYVNSDTYMYAYVGNGASGNVSVTTPGGTATLAGFTYLVAPTVASFYPTSATKGDTVTIIGTGFNNARSVYFGGTNAATYSVIDDNTIRAVVGAGTTGSITVYNAAGSGYLAGFTYIAPIPTITSFTPTSAVKGGYVYIYGTGFTGATSVSFGGVPATSFYISSDTYMYAYVGNGATGSISITTQGGTATLKGFIYATAPNITSFYPTSATRGDTVTIYGSSFSGSSVVSFGGTNAASYTIVDDKTIKAVVGAGSSGNVYVYNAAGSSTLAGFAYNATNKPSITSFSPTAATQGSYVYVSGYGFTGATSVSFGGVPASSFYVYSDTYLYAYVGNGASGSVSITTANGTSSLAGFVYAVRPTVTSFTPTTATKGDTVIIKGTGFSGASTVYFGGTYAASYTVVDGSTIKAVVGGGTSGNVTVYNAAGSAYLAGFTYKAPIPVITNFTPTSAANNTYVYIYGTGFTGATSVSFGGVSASSFYVSNDTTMSAYVGNGATGSVSITTSGGTATLNGFRYIGAPSITSFTPTVASTGSTVTIYGHGFTGATSVSFGLVTASSYSVVNDSTISATVGSGASGIVRVTSVYGAATLAGFSYCKPASATITQTACVSYTWHGTTYTQSGTYTFDTTKAGGCDSLTTLVLTITTPVTPIVSVNGGATSITISAGGTATFTTTVVNGGAAPFYQWYKNGTAILGANLTNYSSSSVSNGDVITCAITSSISCVTASKDTSNSVVVIVSSFSQYTISGNISNQLGYIVPSVTVWLNDSISTTTDALGNYSFTVPAGGNYTVRPFKGNDSLISDGITAFDVALLKGYTLGKYVFSPYKLIAADVNNSGSVTALDVALEKRFTLGVDTLFKGNRLWAFVDSGFVFADITNPFPYQNSISFTNLSSNQTQQSLVGIKLGDLDFNWKPLATYGSSNVQAKPIQLFYKDIKTSTSETEVRVPIRVSNFKNILGMQYTLGFNNT
ncbi:IPT/TIG domain-containing protein, partial [Parasediminibacterium sp. JCM 36343]|uniref:IPT/TIG domain-containing protein n=1 Tax=Parasediminibacterium sp. JCM 36343 TaxID=3374279 RepID=UPI003978D2A9